MGQPFVGHDTLDCNPILQNTSCQQDAHLHLLVLLLVNCGYRDHA